MNTRGKTQTMVYYGMIFAIIILMSLVPFLGFIQVGPVAITLVHIPVIIGAILFGWRAGALFGLVFGLSSMFVAMTRGATPIDVLFINPLVSVLPRVIFGALIYPVYKMFEKVQASEGLAIGLAAFVSSAIHSVVVLTAIFIALNLQASAGIFDNALFQNIIAAVLTINVTLEAVVSTVIAIPLVKALRKSLKNRA